MVALFGLIVWVGSLVGWPRAVGLPVLSAWRFLWLVPLTLIPQWFMGLAGPNFGPDTALGIIPPPHLLLFYTIFFGFGALYFDANDVQGRLGRYWWLLLPIGLLVAFPVGLFNLGSRPLTALAQVLYAWVMSFGLMGLLRVALKQENRSIRYLSDASYWLYLAHLPLIIGGQSIVRNWPWPAISKFLLISLLATVILLIIYQLFVRYTWIGLMLNGRRRRGSVEVPAAVTWEMNR
jgi:peptidoglycan/LPS O-acetylase OafA/YrhL